MPTVRFTATPTMKTWVHRKGGRTTSNQWGTPTTVIVGPIILNDGDEVEMDDFETQWATTHYPENFTAEP